MNKNIFKVLEEQPTEEKPYYVRDYPYGFRLRTEIRYWIETTKRGQRFISQTLNPKTNLWNNPKKSTYDNIMLIGLNKKEHINYVSLRMYSTEEAESFFTKYNQFLSEHQHKEYKAIIGMLKVYDKVEYTIKERRYKHKVTGEIKTVLNCFELNDFFEIDGEGNAVNQEEEEQKKKEDNRDLNKLAVLSATKEGVTVNEAVDTLNRC